MQKDTGASVRISNLSKGLADLGNRIDLILPGVFESRKTIDGVIVHRYKGFLSSDTLRLFSKVLGVLRPNAFFFYDPLFIAKACRIIRNSEIVQFEQQSAGLIFVPIVAKILRRPIVMDCHDIFQALRIKNTSFLRRLFETFVEKMVYRFASVIIVVSEKEKQLLCSFGIRQDRIKVISNGVDVLSFSPSQNVKEIRSRYGLTDQSVVVFVGNMEYLPNQEAVRAIALTIAPKVMETVKDTKFLIVGRNNGFSYPNLTFTGAVESVAPILAASDIAIAPLLHGSGTRLKILEYFSCGLPVISTRIGAEGLDIKNGVQAIIEDDLTAFSFQVIQLLKDDSKATHLREAGRQLVVEKYSWSSLALTLNKICQSLISSVSFQD